MSGAGSTGEHEQDSNTGTLPICLLACGATTGIAAALWKAEVEEGSSVAVFGAGMVGLGAVAGAKLRGAERIFVVDKSPERLELAKRWGATDLLEASDTTVEEIVAATDGMGADYTFEATGLVGVMGQAVEAARMGWGLCTVLGVAGRGEALEIVPRFLITGRKVQGGSFGGAKGRTHVPQLVDMYQRGELDLDGFVSHRITLDEASRERAGIEKGARETRLDLRLVGVVASSEDGLGHAMIEHRKKQDIYAVDDKLPVSGRVTLAKVMPQQVVLNNGGTYELLKLFDKEGLSAQVPAPAPRRQSRPTSEAVREVSGGERADELARQYRDQLYTNPQSLAEVVRVSAVREGNNLVGYRIAPGREPEQLTALGLRDGDLVTAVNGIALDDPSNTVKLYQAMRTAQEATFEIQRNGRPFTVSVNLADPAEGR